MRNFLLLLLCFQLLNGQYALAQELTSGDNFNDLSGNTDLAQVQPSGPSNFLPVNEAFKLELFWTGGDSDSSNKLQLLWDIAPAYYLYQHRFKLTAEIEGKSHPLTPTFATRGLSKYDDYFEKELEVYYNSIEINAVLPATTQPFTLSVQSQGCADAGLCYPPQTQRYSIDPQSGQIALLTPSRAQPTGIETPSGTASELALLPYILLLAIAGGMILNLMPCVFPVLSIKALSMAEAHQSNHSQHIHGWMYSAGAVASFVVVAALMLIARAGGEAVGWGFQLQSPILVSLLAYLFFAMGLSLSGLVTFGTRLMGLGQNLTQSPGRRSSFFTGVLAAVVASPCTAPFMGTALGYALTQPAAVSLLIFAALGFGMALPFLVLCYIPHLGRYLPAAGPWMETLRQSLAFPLYLAAIWLLWVLGRQAGSDSVALVCVGALLIAFAFWLSHGAESRHWGRGLATATALFAALLIPFGLTRVDSHPDVDSRWQAYSPERLTSLRQNGTPVFINLTADWCLTCLTNERLALHTDAVEAAFDHFGVATLKGDWTNSNADITRLLNQYGRSGVPLYLMFPANSQGPAKILPQILTQKVLLSAIQNASIKSNKEEKNTLATNK